MKKFTSLQSYDESGDILVTLNVSGFTVAFAEPGNIFHGKIVYWTGDHCVLLISGFATTDCFYYTDYISKTQHDLAGMSACGRTGPRSGTMSISSCHTGNSCASSRCQAAEVGIGAPNAVRASAALKLSTSTISGAQTDVDASLPITGRGTEDDAGIPGHRFCQTHPTIFER